MKRTILLPALLVALASGATCAPKAPKYTLNIPKLEAKLDNGLRVIVLPDTTTDLVEVDVRYTVGSKEDPEGKAGLAHLVEHLMFQQRPAGPDRPPIGAVIRQLSLYYNAFTNWDSTHYQVLAPAAAVEELVSLEAARLVTGCDTITEEVFQKELEVVRNEMRFRMGTPEGVTQYKLLEAIFPENHPYRREIGGDDETLASIKLEDVCKFMRDYYVPERATMIIAGNITEERAAEISAKWLREIPARKGAPLVQVPQLSLKRKRVDLVMDVEEPTIFVAWALPPNYTVDGQAAGFMMSALAGRTSAFGQRWEFATDVGVYPLGGAYAPVMVLQVSLRSSDDVDEALDFIGKAANTADWGIEEGEDFEQLRRQMVGDLTMAFESLNTRTVLFGDYAQLDPEQRFFAGELARIKATTGGMLKRVIADLADPDKAVVVVVKNGKSGQGKYKRASLRYQGGGPTATTEEFEVDPAEAKTILEVSGSASPIANARRFTLDNGLDVVLLPTESSLPVMTVAIVFKVGTAHEPPDKAGLAEWTAQMMRGEPGSINLGGATYFTDVLAYVGAQQGRVVTADSTMFLVRGLNIYTDVLITGLERLIKTGNYNQEAVENRQNIFRFRMKRKAVKASLELERELLRALYGPEHPYAKTGVESAETLGRIGKDALWTFKEKHYSAKNATLVVTGNFDDKKVEGVIRDQFGDWSGGHQDAPVAKDPPPRQSGARAIGVVGEEGANLQLRVVFPARAGIDDAYAARLILAQMLTRRMNDIRERLGASYGVYARFLPRVGPGMYTIGGPVDAPRAGEVIQAIQKSIESLRNGEEFDEDFVRARRLVLQDYVTTSSDSLALAQQLSSMAVYELPPDHVDKLIKRIATTTPAQVRALIARDLDPNTAIYLLLGGRADIEKSFGEAGLTHAEIRE